MGWSLAIYFKLIKVSVSCPCCSSTDRLSKMCGAGQQEPVARRLREGWCVEVDVKPTSAKHVLFSRMSPLPLDYVLFSVPKALTEYKAELRDDPIISTHLTKLYDNLLEQNLIRVIEPFSRVQVILLSPSSDMYSPV